MNERQDVVLGLAKWVLRGLAVLSLLGVVAGVLGASGTMSLYDRHVPRPVPELAQRLWPQSGDMPTSLVKVRPAHWDDTNDEFNGVAAQDGEMPAGAAQFRDVGTAVVGGAGEMVFYDPGLPRRVVWLIAIAVVPVGLAWLWWTLSRIVLSARTGDPFSQRNARRLAIAGVVIVLGPPLALLFQQLVLRWMLANSTAAGKADIWFRWESLPLWTLGVGLAMLVLAAVWRRGVAMREDLEGLV